MFEKITHGIFTVEKYFKLNISWMKTQNVKAGSECYLEEGDSGSCSRILKEQTGRGTCTGDLRDIVLKNNEIEGFFFNG